jgi:hypothetical protein
MKPTAILNIGKAGMMALTVLMMATHIHAEVRSKSHDLIVMEPRDLPEQAQTPGNSFFLYQDDNFNTYLYIEQQQGARLSVFDVTDPAKIKLVSSTALTVPGAYDFVRPLDGHAEMIRFRDNKGVAVLDLRKAKNPTFKIVSTLSDPGATEALGESGFLIVNEPHDYVRAIPRDYQVVDIATPSDPTVLATVKQVKHTVVNRDTGTTFLLGIDGLTIVRRTRVEEDYRIQLITRNSN